MSNEGNGALSLDEVSRRFADSAKLLADARDRLGRLATAEESAVESAASLKEAAAAVGEFAHSATALIGELEQAQQQTREVLEAGARFLDGSELRELKARVAALTQAVNERLAEADERAAELQTELDRRTAKLSSRQRKQLGLV